MEKKGIVWRYILPKGMLRFEAKRLPDHREDLSFCRPTFSGQAAAILAYGF
ncbi:hypothetical protein [Elizabethkingia meningoseptica]|uniref:hypothetical protein n=1 Tax=Elizabethkingia meningoseptica TaxID=238 RepID=UPI0023B1E560|nr:hypothetical protein [Elizabethkingia meningoseptica]MDE5492757.1 hypothetical protein [Elizabethkingia meningoseptica]